MTYRLFPLCILLALCAYGQAQVANICLPPAPGDTPELFMPGMLCTGAYERDITMSPDGKELYIGVIYGRCVTILFTRCEKGAWTPLEVAPFAQDPNFFYFEPHVTPDGQKLMFLCTRPPKKDLPPKPGWSYQHIWQVHRLPDGSWSEPYPLSPPINSEENEFYPSVTRDGTLYFTRSDKTGKGRIMRAPFVDGAYQQPEPLPDPVNGQGNLFNAFIAPDESFLIACITGRKDALTEGANHYIFFRYPDGAWSEGINLGETINAPGHNASSQYVSPDGKYFFFAAGKNVFLQDTLTYSLLQRMHNSPRNGLADIYWLKAGFLAELKKQSSSVHVPGPDSSSE